MPSLQQFRYLIALADTLHFRRAAEACHVTQPTLSAQLKEMELRLGAKLVERSRSRVLLTPLGREVAARGRRILREVEDVRELARIADRPYHGTYRVGVVQSVGSYLLPHLLPDLHDRHPHLGLYVREELPGMLLDRLEEGGLDLLFHPLPINRVEVETAPLYREPLLVVAPCDHRLADAVAVRRDDLKGETILTLEPGHKLFEQVREIAAEVEADLSADFEGTSLDTLRQMVAMGMGLSLLPALYVRSEVVRETLVVARPIAPRPPSRIIGMAWRKESARRQEFRDLAGIIRKILAQRTPEVTVLS